MTTDALRYFTVEEANRRLPLVRMIVRDIAELFSDVQARRERLEDLTAKARPRTNREGDLYAEELRQMEQELLLDEARLKGYFEELEELGIDLQDPLAGVVDFPAISAGRDICLSWKLGEDAISFWHEIDASHESRLPLSDLEEAPSSAQA
jgi:hypothetical protein